MAKEALGGFLALMEKDGYVIPEPTKPEDLNLKRNQGYYLVTVYDMPAVRKRMEYENARLKLTLTSPGIWWNGRRTKGLIWMKFLARERI